MPDPFTTVGLWFDRLPFPARFAFVALLLIVVVGFAMDRRWRP